MKKATLTFLARIIFSALIISTFTATVLAHPSGAPAGVTGSPGDLQNCVSCHNGSAATVSNWITTNIPAQGYTAGTTYTITVTVTGSGKKGFEVSPQNVSGAQLGVLAAGSGSKLVGGTKYVTHSAGSNSNPKIWTFSWTAPVAGTGPVNFYGAFTVSEPVTKLSVTTVNENVLVPLSATASAIPSLICAGQSSQLNVAPAGGSGSYTYSWTSIPPGFTSSIRNPVVSPTISTQYIAHVSDGANAIDAPTNVAVTQQATVNAGNDTTCAFEITQVPLLGIAANYATVLWTSSGSGTFSAANSLSGYYYPAIADKTEGAVTLTLTANPQSPCTTAATDSRIIHFDFPAGIDLAKGDQAGMVISPNPSHGRFTLRATGVDHQEAIVTIWDITGRTVVKRSLDPSETGAEQFDLTGNPKGLYLVKIQTGSESVVRKLVIE